MSDITLSDTKPIASYADFYRYYLSEHSNPVCRVLHFVGTALVFAVLGFALATGRYWALLLVPVCGYGFAWVGHFFFERNRPTTFRYPIWSLFSDFRMFFALVFGRISLWGQTATPRKDEKRPQPAGTR
jgi:hypothetical protein